MMMTRILSFIGVVLASLFLPFWFFILYACIYALIYGPLELLVLAVCIDAQFGDVKSGVWYQYTLAVVGILIISVSLKPYLRFYE